MKATMAIMMLGASALAAKASFTDIPVTDQTLAQTATDGFTTAENSYVPADNNLRRISSSLNTSSGADPRSVIGVVPETTTLLAGALLLLPFGMSALRVLRRDKSDPAEPLNTI